MFIDKYMRMAYTQAQLAFNEDEVPVGAVILDRANKDIVIKTYNQMRKLNDPTAHAEILAIRALSQQLKTERLTGYDLYVSLEPCTMCAAAISYAHFDHLYFGAYDIKSGGVDHGVKFFEQKNCHYKPIIVGGIMEKENRALLQSFFQKKRGL